jgi:hypothetical protein
MKTVYQSNSALASAWANKRLDRRGGEFRANNMWATHTKIFSYGSHFCIAEHRNGMTLFTERTYSNTTAKHKNHVLRAVPKDKLVFVPALTGNTTPVEWVAMKVKEAGERFDKAKRARKWKRWVTVNTVETFNEAAKLAETFEAPLPTPAALPPGYLDFLVVEAFKAKCDGQDFPKLHSCYTTTPTAVAA